MRESYKKWETKNELTEEKTNMSSLKKQRDLINIGKKM